MPDDVSVGMACGLCGAAAAETLETLAPGTAQACAIFRCRGCGTLFRDPKLDVGVDYATDYPAYHTFRWLSPKTVLLGKKTLQACLLARRGRRVLLDVGCGAGMCCTSDAR